jgi:tRNA(Arg) A34 adenosine deaminase TadA
MDKVRKSRKQYKLVATIYDKKGKKLSRGENSYVKTHPYQIKLAKKVGRPDAVFLHAEIQALVRLKDKSKAHRIVIERFDVNGNPRPASPCAICSLAIEESGIQIIEHT